jgi:outer membrane protein assembly factor BamA
VEAVEYPVDTFFNRRPWVEENGHRFLAARDRGTRAAPLLGLSSNRDLGIVPRLGLKKYRYGFRHRPYSSAVALQADYATKLGGFRLALTADKRLEASPVHVLVTARWSELEMINFHGYGNATPDAASSFFDARQRQWLLQPAVARSLGLKSDLSLGPVIQYSVSDTTTDRFLTVTHPYGFANFGQAGLRLSLHLDSRDVSRDPRRGLLVDLSGTVYPAVWDVTSTYAGVVVGAATYLKVPVPVHPVLVLRGGGKKLFGAFPFNDAAFIGGRSTLRSLDAERYAGDAAVYGSAELRVRVARFVLLLPVDAGVFGIVDAGRVYVNGDSPGGWHTSAGVGFWIGVPDPSTAIRMCRRPGGSGPC